jgi:hypothetical protein
MWTVRRRLARLLQGPADRVPEPSALLRKAHAMPAAAATRIAAEPPALALVESSVAIAAPASSRPVLTLFVAGAPKASPARSATVARRPSPVFRWG